MTAEVRKGLDEADFKRQTLIMKLLGETNTSRVASLKIHFSFYFVQNK